MFKRKPRIIFCSRQSLPALIALSCLDSLGDEIAEGRALALDNNPEEWPGQIWQDVSLPAVRLSAADGDLLAWGDLLITLDEEPAVDISALPGQLRHRAWTLDGAEGEAELIAALSKRVAGMLGGIRMMSRQ